MKKIVKRILYVYYSFYCALFCKKKYNILSEDETKEKIIDGNYSVARFGDGEFKWILKVKQNSFQKQSDELSNQLLDTLKNNDSNCLVGIPRALNSTKGYNFEASFYWKRFKVKYLSKLNKILDDKKIYIDANFTRPYIDFKDKTNMKQKFEKLKKIWDNRDVLIVEGENVNFGVGNDLLSNSSSIKRILCPNKNAFDYIDKIYDEVVKYYNGQIVLVALGPTATVLSNRLSKNSIQAIDIGHADVEYCWYLSGCLEKRDIKGKNVNERTKQEGIDMMIKEEEKERDVIAHIGIDR